MKKTLLCATLLAFAGATGACSMDDQTQEQLTPATADDEGLVHNGETIFVSCFRGPWFEVIIDRPNEKFLDSLMAAGFSEEAAKAVGRRICRDQELVGNLETMLPKVKQILRDADKS